MTVRRVRVGLDVTPLLGPPSGIRRVVADLVAAVTALDDLVVSGWVLSARARHLPRALPVVHRRLPAGLVHRLWAVGDLPPGRLVTGPVDVVHGTNYVVPPGSRSLVTVQDLTPVRGGPGVGAGVRRMGRVLQRAVGSGAWVHAPCRAVADEVGEVLGVPADRLVVIPNAVGPLPDPDPDRGRRLAGADHFVLALGETHPRKNLPLLVEALDHLPDEVVLVVAGPVGRAEGTLADAARVRNRRSRLVRLTGLSDRDRVDLLAAARLAAFPSGDEGYGLPPLEAVWLGRPVVATAVGALPELLGPHGVDLVDPGDPGAFLAALVTAVSDPVPPPPAAVDAVRRLDAAGMARRLAAVYRRLAGA